jgi:hypothetical protein
MPGFFLEYANRPTSANKLSFMKLIARVSASFHFSRGST